MLIDEMLYYLRNNISEDQLKSYKDLLPFLHSLNPAGFEFSMRQFVAFNDGQVAVDNIAQFNNSLLQLLMEEIENFGLYISDLQPVADKIPLFTKMLMALYRIDQYEDLLSIKYILDAAHDGKETIAEIIILMDGTLTAEGIMEMTDSVSPALIARIREFIKDLDYNFDLLDKDATEGEVERIRIALDYYGIAAAKRYFIEAGTANEPIDNYLQFFYSNIENHSPEELAKLAVFSAIASGEANKDIKARLGELLPYYFTDPSLLIKVTRAVMKLSLPEVEHA